MNGSFDLVVLDINLPGRDGFAILRSMREQSLSCPVLVITARNQIADKIDLLELGADDYLVKPFDLRELVARIRAVARRHMGVAQPVLRIGELSINLTQRSVMQGTIHWISGGGNSTFWKCLPPVSMSRFQKICWF